MEYLIKNAIKFKGKKKKGEGGQEGEGKDKSMSQEHTSQIKGVLTVKSEKV